MLVCTGVPGVIICKGLYARSRIKGYIRTAYYTLVCSQHDSFLTGAVFPLLITDIHCLSSTSSHGVLLQAEISTFI